MQEQLIELVDYGKIIETLKPGSHMPPMHLRQAAGTAWDTVPI